MINGMTARLDPTGVTLGFARATAALASLFMFMFMPAGPAGADPGDNALVSVDPATQRAAGHSVGTASISDSGRYVAFDSEASTLVPGDTNGWSDVFLRDRVTGITERISVGFGGVEPNGGSSHPVVSGDGRYVAFNSWAHNLVASPTVFSEVYVHDRVTGVTRRASIGSSLINSSSLGGISDDGRYVTFINQGGIYVRDMVAGSTTLIYDMGSTAPDPVISGNGRFVLYTFPYGPVLYIHDRQSKTTQVLSDQSSGAGSAERWIRASISRDGRWVAYASTKSEVAGDTNQNVDVYLLDRTTGQKRLVSVSASGKQTTAYSVGGIVSDDGRRVAFVSYGAGLVAGAPADAANLLVKDMETGAVEYVASTQHDASLSGDGSWLGFVAAEALVTRDLNGTNDTYVHEVGQSTTVPDVANYYLRPLRIDFGQVAVSSSQTRGFALVNAGNVALPITTLEISGPNRFQFALNSYCKSPLPAGERCWIAITFKPTTAGYKQAHLHVVAGGIERNRALTGTAVP